MIFFCASWGCETTGDSYWKPSSSWDYITVKAHYPHHSAFWSDDVIPGCKNSNTTTKGWCNPLQINFTSHGKKESLWTSRPLTWGLRLYKDHYDQGLLFQIKLLKGVPIQNRASVGPNKQLHQPGTSHQPGTPPKSGGATASTHPKTTMYQPTIPPGPASSASLIMAVVNASAQALVAATNATTNVTSYTECWICYSSDPPFYEGIAIFDNITYTNDTSLLSWGPVELTLTEVSGLGTCLLRPNMNY